MGNVGGVGDAQDRHRAAQPTVAVRVPGPARRPAPPGPALTPPPAPTLVDTRLATAYAPTLPYLDVSGAAAPAARPSGPPPAAAPGPGPTPAAGTGAGRRAARPGAPTARGGPRPAPAAGGVRATAHPTVSAPVTVPGRAPSPPPGPEGGRVTAQPTGSPASGRAAGHRAVRSPATRGGRRRRGGPEGPDGFGRLVSRALVVAVLAGGTTAFVADDKAVRISVDGDSRTVRTFADDVAELLAEEAVTVAAHDTVAPAPGAALTDGETVEIRRAGPAAPPPVDAPDRTAVESLLARLRAQAGAG